MTEISRRPAIGILILTLLWGLTGSSVAQKESVKPGINKSFDNPNVAQFVERWEREGREVYDKRHEIVKATGARPGLAIADVGSGTGLFTMLLADAVGSKGKVYAVDITEEFLEHVKSACKEKDVSNVTTVLCRPDDVLLEPHSVDVVFICATYHHFEFPLKSMASIDKALKPDGRVVVVDFHRIPGQSSDFIMGHVRADQQTVLKEIQSCGFQLIADEQDMFEENYLMVFTKK